jgi:hypothetical protein
MTRPRLLAPVDPPMSYRGHRLDGPVDEFHDAVDWLRADTVPQSYYEKVKASQARELVR